MGTRTLTRQLKGTAQELGFVACAIAEATPLPETRDVIEARVERGSYEGLPFERAMVVAAPGVACDPASRLVVQRAWLDVQHRPVRGAERDH